MTDADLDKLEALAKAATQAKRDNDRWEALDALEAAANPATILDLIASARRDAEEIERLKKVAEALSAAISWLDYPFIDNNTSEAELLSRVGFMMRDAERHRAALTARAAHTGEG